MTIAVARPRCCAVPKSRPAPRVCALTPVRRRALEILLELHRAMGAYEVLERLAEDGYGKQPPVAYRALDFLVEQGLAHRIQRLNAYAACLSAERDHAPVFLICRGCEQVAEADATALRGALQDLATGSEFIPGADHGRAAGPLRPLPRGRPGMSALIRATDLSVSHAGADLPVLRHVDFHISPAEIVTVVGPNGSGKSTLVRALLGHVPAETGRVERLPGLRIGYVPQRVHIERAMPMTVRRFLSLPVRVGEAEARAGWNAPAFRGSRIARSRRCRAGSSARPAGAGAFERPPASGAGRADTGAGPARHRRLLQADRRGPLPDRRRRADGQS